MPSRNARVRPHSAQANQLLKEAALAAKMPELVLFALETIIAGHSTDIKTMHELAKLIWKMTSLLKAGQMNGSILECSQTISQL